MSYGMKEDQNMPRKNHTHEEIVATLRQVDVLVSQGIATAEAVRQNIVTEVMHHRWRQDYGSLKLDQAKGDRNCSAPRKLEHSELEFSAAISLVSLPPTLDHGAGLRPVLLSLPPTLDHGAGLRPVLSAQAGPCGPEQFMSDIGGLLPMALCGRTSL
jgi:hypothetical protein